MKKLLLILMALLPVMASAYDVEIEGIYYNISGNELEVTRKGTGVESYSGVVDIPETITLANKTYTVTKIGSFAFNQCKGLTKVVIPNSVTVIKEYAFDTILRKPNPGMLKSSASDYNIDLESSWIVGDGMNDVLAGKNAGVRPPVMSRSGLWKVLFSRSVVSASL